MAKKKECANCHCERIITLTSRVHIAIGKYGTTFQYRRLCIPCLLSVLNLSKEPLGEYDYEKAMTCVE